MSPILIHDHRDHYGIPLMLICNPLPLWQWKPWLPLAIIHLVLSCSIPLYLDRIIRLLNPYYSTVGEGTGTHSSTLAWKIAWTEKPGRLQSMRSLRVRQTEQLHFHFSLSCIGEGNDNPLQYSCLENPRDRGAWWAAAYGVAQSRTRRKRLSSSKVIRRNGDRKGNWCFLNILPHLYLYLK